ncbi:host attachment protein [Sulfurospirillum oryzae]|uniref:host attachment protein n=1 Tax=Sulfurospirillum oryzae TaxID=2976535 RepID=UPI0021E787BF|nr:host attachment protein [Sulfurospirillum oryzae]
MSSKLVVVADLQHFKLFRIKADPMGRESLECLLSSDSLDIHLKPSEKLSDRLGHCETAWGRQGSGENHNMAEEEEQKRIRELVLQISEALLKYDHDEWYFAAPKSINQPIVGHLNSAIKTSMTQNLTLDLTKTPTDAILGHFAQ